MTATAKLTARQEALLAALLARPGCTLKAAAKKARVSYASARRYAALPEFKAAWRAGRREITEHATAQLQLLAEEAVKTLRKNLKAPRAGDQIRASVAILQERRKDLTQDEVNERLKTIEDRLEAQRQEW